MSICLPFQNRFPRSRRRVPAGVLLAVPRHEAGALPVRVHRSVAKSSDRFWQQHASLRPVFSRLAAMSVLSRDLAAAKQAFSEGDPEASRRAHAVRAAPEKHAGYGPWMCDGGRVAHAL